MGGIARVAIDILAAGLGEAANGTISTLATAALAKTAFDMLGGRDVDIQVQGYGVLLASSIEEATKARVDAAAANAECARGDLAYASRTAAIISLCTIAIRTMPKMPEMSTLTTPNRASLPGILLHEYVHLALNTRDIKYSCHPDGVRTIIAQQIGGPGLFSLGNPDTYRCWVEELVVGAPAP